MFVFYDIQELLTLGQLQLLKLIVERGFVVTVPDLRLSDYTGPIYRRVMSLSENNLVEITEQNADVYDFVQSHMQTHAVAGKSLLALLHFCKTENKILVVDKKEQMVNLLATEFSITTSTLVDFYKETINDEKYLPFITSLKQEGITIQ